MGTAPTAPESSDAERGADDDAYEDLMKFRGKDQEKMMSEALRKNGALGQGWSGIGSVT